MNIDDLAGQFGIYHPEELTVLKSVFDDVRKSHKIVESWQSNALARQILAAYRSGVRERDLLFRTVNNHFKKPRLVRSF